MSTLGGTNNKDNTPLPTFGLDNVTQWDTWLELSFVKAVFKYRQITRAFEMIISDRRSHEPSTILEGP
jgi:hypothetical protein